jgi:hypothetical protein
MADRFLEVFMMPDDSDGQVEDEHATYLEYAGHAGATAPCAEAVEHLLQSRRPLAKCLILTCREHDHPSHALLIEDVFGDHIVVKAGFSSGYGGTGPKGFSATLALLNWHGVELDEVEVEERVIERLDGSALTLTDVATIENARRIRPQRLWSYILELDEMRSDQGNPWTRRELVVPLGILDERLAPMARSFWEDPDRILTRAYRALEEAVKEKAGISQEEANAGPSKVYGAAFNPPGLLHWSKVSSSEQAGRASLFIGTVKAYRNPRAHRQLRDHPEDALRELLLVNHLFRLEAEAVRREKNEVSIADESDTRSAS